MLTSSNIYACLSPAFLRIKFLLSLYIVEKEMADCINSGGWLFLIGEGSCTL